MNVGPHSGELRVRLGAWYGDEERALRVPGSWDVTVLAPRTPPPLTDEQIRTAVENPVGQPPLRMSAAGKRHPIIIVDDLTRPTPTDRVVPHILRELVTAGIAPSQVAIILASGTHGHSARDAVRKKAGAEAAAACGLLVHDARKGGVNLGRTDFGTPVIVDREVAMSDLLIGVGGVYPQHSVGFGGGSKLVLGILGRRSIVALHYGHPSVGGSYETRNDFRRDLDQAARIAGLRTVVSLHVDAARRPVRVVAGDPEIFFEEAAEFARRHYSTAVAGDAYDVAIANAYPMDASLTFARSKGLAPLAFAGAHASRVLIAACPEGLGLHGLFPYLNGPRFETQIHRLRRLSVMRPSTIPPRVVRKLRAKITRPIASRQPTQAAFRQRQQFAGEVSTSGGKVVHLWAPMAPPGSLPEVMPGFSRVTDWDDVVTSIQAEHPDRDTLRVALYPCSPLQCLQTEAQAEAADPEGVTRYA